MEAPLLEARPVVESQNRFGPVRGTTLGYYSRGVLGICPAGRIVSRMRQRSGFSQRRTIDTTHGLGGKELLLLRIGWFHSARKENGLGTFRSRAKALAKFSSRFLKFAAVGRHRLPPSPRDLDKRSGSNRKEEDYLILNTKCQTFARIITYPG